MTWTQNNMSYARDICSMHDMIFSIKKIACPQYTTVHTWDYLSKIDRGLTVKTLHSVRITLQRSTDGHETRLIIQQQQTPFWNVDSGKWTKNTPCTLVTGTGTLFLLHDFNIVWVYLIIKIVSKYGKYTYVYSIPYTFHLQCSLDISPTFVQGSVYDHVSGSVFRIKITHSVQFWWFYFTI